MPGDLRMREARQGAARPGWEEERPAPSPFHPQPPRRGPFKSGRGALWRRSGARCRSQSPSRIPEPERSGVGAERAERAEPAAELGARAGGMYRARAARAGPEPGSPGRFGILSTGQLRDLLQDEPKLDRIVRLSRKVARGARAGGSGDGPRPAGPANRPKGRTGRAEGPPEPGTYEWARWSRPRGRGRPELAWGGWGAGDPGRRPCTPGMAARRVLQRLLQGGVFRGAGGGCLWGPWLAHPRL